MPAYRSVSPVGKWKSTRFVSPVTATAETTGQTGVEMEALTAASVAALTLYDMAKAIDRAMTITGVQLVEKTGGKSGDFKR